MQWPGQLYTIAGPSVLPPDDGLYAMKNTDQISLVIYKYLQGEGLTDDEQQLLDSWLSASETNKDVFKNVQNEKAFGEYLSIVSDKQGIENAFNDFRASLPPVKVPLRRGYFLRAAWVRYAAAFIIFFGIGAYLWTTQKQQPGIIQTTKSIPKTTNDVQPGKFAAKLTLADGSTISLDSAAVGELVTQGSTVVVNRNRQLIYQPQAGRSEMMYNTLTTGNGETYSTVLSDGSKVWLNAASSIKYPVAFSDKRRDVEITGEAYFEIKHDVKIPFQVMVDGIEIHDLGTEFNVNAYSNELEVKTTLVSGSARVVKGEKNKLLTPGQQAHVRADRLEIVDNADVESAIAWKSGRFYFENSSVPTIMRQVERWYNVKVEFKDRIPHLFVAKIPRDVPVSELLELLELTGRVHFTVEGKKVTVTK